MTVTIPAANAEARALGEQFAGTVTAPAGRRVINMWDDVIAPASALCAAHGITGDLRTEFVNGAMTQSVALGHSVARRR